MKRESVNLREDNWSALSAIAVSLNCTSWRVLLRRIAVGEICCYDKAKAEGLVSRPAKPVPYPGLFTSPPSTTTVNHISFEDVQKIHSDLDAAEKQHYVRDPDAQAHPKS